MSFCSHELLQPLRNSAREVDWCQFYLHIMFGLQFIRTLTSLKWTVSSVFKLVFLHTRNFVFVVLSAYRFISATVYTSACHTVSIVPDLQQKLRRFRNKTCLGLVLFNNARRGLHYMRAELQVHWWIQVQALLFYLSQLTNKHTFFSGRDIGTHALNNVWVR